MNYFCMETMGINISLKGIFINYKNEKSDVFRPT